MTDRSSRRHYEIAGRGQRARAYALVAGAVVLWASWPPLATLVDVAPPFLVLGASALIGCLVSFVLAARQGSARSFVRVPFGTLVFVAAGLMGNNAFYLAAIARIGPAEANVVHYLWPVFLVLIVAALHHRAPTRAQALGVALGFAGVATALSPQMDGRLDAAGVLLGVCGALTFAVYSAGRSVAKVEAGVVGPALGLAGIGALVAHAMLESVYAPTIEEWLVIAAMGVGPFTIANVLWDRATRVGEAPVISGLAFLTPLVAIGLLGAYGLASVGAAVVVGALLAIIGAVLSSRTSSA